MIYLFDLDDSLTSYKFTTRTEQLTKWCGPLQKMRVRLGACKTGLSPPSIDITDCSKAILLIWFHLFYVFESNFCVVKTLFAFTYFCISLCN